MTKEDLIVKLEENVDKIYFYCIKRCNSKMDAEDLSQTILLEILQNISKGIKIDNFDYYIWTICKNQYNRYLKQIVNTREILDFVEEIDEPGNNISALDEMIYDENIRRMNAAIKLLSKDYNEILYAYYVEDKKLAYIAEELSLPLGTVKRKLAEIRKKLKGYLDMEKLNGKKAYVPVNFTTCISSQKIGNYNPQDYVDTLINKNLLYHSYNNPCSLEDYSIELGISLPYIKDIVDKLVKVTLLKKIDNGKYITNFPYVTKDILEKNDKILLENYKIYTDELIKFAKAHIDQYKELITYANLTNEEAMWSFCLYLNYEVLNDVKPKFSLHTRPDGGKWDFYITDLRDMNKLMYDMSINTYNDGIDKVQAYAFPCSNDNSRLAFNKCANGKENYELLNELLFVYPAPYENIVNRVLLNKKDEINDYISKGFLKVVDNKIKFNFPFFKYHDFKKVEKMINSDELNIAKEKLQIIINKLTLSMKDYLPSYLEDYTNSLISNQLWNIQSLVLEAFKEAKLLDLKEQNEFFPYNMIMITSDICMIYEK